jgi:hypothetical protein
MRAVLLLALVAACGPAATIGDDDDTGGADAAPGAGPDADPNRPDAAPAAENAAVYAHSSGALYRVDPDDLEVTLVGNFGWPNGSDSMTDIAIDRDGNMVGVSFDSVYAIDKDTAAATYLAPLQGQFNGLSFVAAGPDPNDEILVGAALSGAVYQIDPMNGNSTMLGNYGGGLGSSGDLVYVRGFGTVATVTDGVGNDKLARIDPGNGWSAELIGTGDTGATSIWGLGFWKNQVYGFTDTRQFLLIDTVTGLGTPIETSSVNWWGAAVTTSAPIVD